MPGTEMDRTARGQEMPGTEMDRPARGLEMPGSARTNCVVSATFLADEPMPGEAQTRKALMVKKAHGKVDLKVVDRLQSLHKDGFPELVRSRGACGMPAAVLGPPVGSSHGPRDGSSTIVGSPVVGSPYPCEVYSAATPPLRIPGSTRLDNSATIASIAESADSGCRCGRPAQRSTCNAARLGGAPGSPGVADDAQVRAASSAAATPEPGTTWTRREADEIRQEAAATAKGKEGPTCRI